MATTNRTLSDSGPVCIPLHARSPSVPTIVVPESGFPSRQGERKRGHMMQVRLFHPFYVDLVNAKARNIKRVQRMEMQH